MLPDRRQSQRDRCAGRFQISLYLHAGFGIITCEVIVMNAAGRQSNGIIKISDEVIAVCAANATLKTKGVADLAGRHFQRPFQEFSGQGADLEGDKVSQSEDGVELDVHIIVKYHAKYRQCLGYPGETSRTKFRR